LMQEGFVGRLFSYRAAYLHAGYVEASRPMSWRLDAEVSGGGALHDLGSHVIDLMQHLAGGIRRVSACSKTFATERPTRDGGRAKVEVDDLTLVQAELDAGGLGTIESSRVAAVQPHGSELAPCVRSSGLDRPVRRRPRLQGHRGGAALSRAGRAARAEAVGRLDAGTHRVPAQLCELCRRGSAGKPEPGRWAGGPEDDGGSPGVGAERKMDRCWVLAAQEWRTHGSGR